MGRDNVRTFDLIIRATAKGVAQVTRDIKGDFAKTSKAMKAFNKAAGNGKRAVRLLTGELKLLIATTLSYQSAMKAVAMVSGFDQKFTEVTTLVRASGEELGRLKGEIIDISKTVPQSASDLTAAEYDIISAGVALEDSTGVLEMAAKAAVAGITDTKTAANVGVSAMNAYGLEVQDLGRIYDVLFQTVKDGVTTFPELATHLGKLLPIARSAGVDLETVGAALAAMTKAGMKTEVATTALRGAIAALSSPGAAARKAMEELGITWNGLEGTIRQIADRHLGAAALREIIPDINARTAVSSLAQNYQVLEGNLARMPAAAGATQAAFDKMSGTLQNRWQQIKNIVAAAILQNRDFGAALGQVIERLRAAAPEIGRLVGRIITLVGKLAAWSAENQKLLATLVGAGGLLLGLKKLADLVLAGKFAVEAFRQAGLPTTIKASGEAAVEAAAGFSLATKWLGAAGLVLAAALAGRELGKLVKTTLKWSAEMDRGNEVLEEQLPLIDRHGEKLRAIADQLGIAIADQEEYNDLMRVGAIYRDRENNQLRLNYELYIRYHGGLIRAAEGHRELAAGARKSAAEQVAGAEAAARAQAELDRFIASLPASSKALDSYAVKVADLKLALAEGEISQAEFNARMLKLNRDHWAAEVKILETALAEEKKKFDAGKATVKDYEKAVLKLKDAKLKLVEATNSLAEAEGQGQSSLERFGKRVDRFAEKLHLSAEQTEDLKTRLGLLKRSAGDAGEGLKELDHGAGRANDQLGRLGNQLSLTAIAAADTADWGYRKWAEFADRLHMSVAELKKAVGEIRDEMDAANAALERWREQTRRKQFSASTRAVVEKYQEADEEIIRGEIKRQQEVIYSFSEWISPQQKVKAREIINALEKLLRERRKFATGGMVPGIGDGDTVPALLTPGEYVIRKPAVRALGLDLLNALNRGLDLRRLVPRFNLGGLVPRLELPPLPAPPAPRRFASGGPVPEPAPAGESITVNLVLEGRRFSGLYPRDEGLGLVAALENAQANTV